MYNTSLNFYLTYFYLADFSLLNFKEEVFSLFKNDLQSTDLYNFHLKTTYYMHLFLPSGEIISKLPFELLTTDDKEDLLEDYYLHFLPHIDNYYKNIEVNGETFYMGLYISSILEDKLDPKALLLEKEVYFNNIEKMRMDLLLPISLIKKW